MTAPFVIGADPADLGPARRMKAFAGHRDQRPAAPDAQEHAEFPGPRQEGPRPGPFGQIEHLRAVSGAEPHRLNVCAGRYAVVDQLDAVPDRRDLPAFRRRNGHPGQRDQRARAGQRGQIVPIGPIRVIRQADERRDVDRVSSTLPRRRAKWACGPRSDARTGLSRGCVSPAQRAVSGGFGSVIRQPRSARARRRAAGVAGWRTRRPRPSVRGGHVHLRHQRLLFFRLHRLPAALQAGPAIVTRSLKAELLLACFMRGGSCVRRGNPRYAGTRAARIRRGVLPEWLACLLVWDRGCRVRVWLAGPARSAGRCWASCWLGWC